MTVKPTLFIVKGENNDGPWAMYIVTDSPGTAVDIATKHKAWNVLAPLQVTMPLDFIDAVEAAEEEPGEPIG